MTSKLRMVTFFAILFCLAGIALAEDIIEPEFDGCYVLTQNGKLVELTATEGEMGMYGKRFKDRKYIKCVLAWKARQTATNVGSFKALILKGPYSFEHFSLHPVLEGKVWIVPHSSKQHVYVPGEKIHFRSKTIGSNIFYVVPKQPLSKGKYIAWLGENLWFFDF